MNKEFPDTDVCLLITAGDAYVMRPGTVDGDIDSAKLCAEKVLRTALKTGWHVWEGQSYLLYAKLWREKDDRIKGKEYVLKAEAIFEKDGIRTNFVFPGCIGKENISPIIYRRRQITKVFMS